MMILKTSRSNLSSNDQLALDLPLAETKSITARVGPTPVFTRASTATFIGSNGLIQSAAINEPRFEHDPLTGVCGGLLLEQSRTNTCLQSENFGTTWTNDTGNVAISLDQTTSPSGAMDADKISENTTASNRRIAIQAQSFVSGTTYTFSCFVKAAERDFVQLRFGSAFGGQFQNFVIGGVNAGTIGSGSGATSSIQAYPNGWYRCSITATSAATGSSQVTIGPQVSSTATAWQPYIGTIGSGIFVWGAQLEVGSCATSYIPTTTGSVVRSTDVCSITGANFTSFYNQSEGTIIGQGIIDTVGAGILFPYFVNFNDGTANNRVLLGSTNSAGSGVRPIVVASGSSSFTNPIGTSSAGQSRKVGMVYKQNDFIAAHNGTLTPADNTGNVPSGIDRVAFDGPFFVGTIAAIRFYKKRLSNSKLQALTA
jgi:hypothetical protein